MKNATFVHAAGLRLRVARQGEGRPLLLITGIGANLDMWAPLSRLMPDRELVAFDPPGAGLSQRPRAPLRMRQLAGVVRELLDVLGLERVDVLGYSFGGGLAQELAHRAPDRVRRLVLCATAPGLGGVPPRPLAALALATPARLQPPAARADRPAHRGRAHGARPVRALRARGRAPRPPARAARLRLPALRGGGLVEPPVAAPRRAAGARGRRG
jgi:poly(3-hydroxyoctanoate) depolymerase